MKKIVLILEMFLIILTSYGKERIEDMSKLEYRKRRHGEVFVFGEDKPYTGTFIEKYKNGNVHQEEKYKDGELQESKTYFENGKLSLILIYKNGIENKIDKNYYKNGNLKSERTYISGKAEGNHKMYYENGHLWSESKYKNGEQIAPTKWDDENGKPKPSL